MYIVQYWSNQHTEWRNVDAPAMQLESDAVSIARAMRAMFGGVYRIKALEE